MSRRIAVAGMAALSIAVSIAEAGAQVVRVSVATDGTAANGHSSTPAISDGGRFVAFVSEASNLVAGDTNGVADVFLRDRDTDADGILDESGAVATVRVSERPGVQANGPSQEPTITPDGRYVFFASQASTLFSFGQPPMAFFEVFRWERTTGNVTLVSQTDAGEPLNGGSRSPTATGDGNVVYFVSDATNGPGGDPGISGVILRRDMASGALTAVSDPLIPGANGQQRFVESPRVSGDGGVVMYAMAQHSLSLVGSSQIAVRVGTSATQIYSGIQPDLSRDGRFLSGILASPGGDGPAFRRHLPSGAVRYFHQFRFDARASLSPTGRFMSIESEHDGSFTYDFTFGASTAPAQAAYPNQMIAIDGLDSSLAFASRDTVRQLQDVVVAPLREAFDHDGDQLPDPWEHVFGLDSTPGVGSAGANGAEGDPDNDGLTNSQELAEGSNPVGTFRRLVAEGASSAEFFSTRIAIANPGDVIAKVAVRFDGGDGVGTRRSLLVPARARVTLDSHDELMDGSSFSTIVESDRALVVDRLVSWGTAAAGVYGSHAETSTATPATDWFFAEGSTVLGFQVFYLLQNPAGSPTTATIRFLLPSGAPIVRTYPLPARSRTTVYVNSVPGLESTDVSAEITATQPIAVERAMYRNTSRAFELGHAAAGVAAPAASWFFAEGATGSFFDTYLLLANPSNTAATVTVDYLRDTGGIVTRSYPVAANSRFSVFVDSEAGLEATSFGMRVTSAVPIVAERTMYWAGGFFDYYEGHVSSGATATGSHWLLAEGEIASPAAPFQAETFALIANTGALPATVVLRTLPEPFAGTLRQTAPFTIPAHSRVTVPLSTVPNVGSEASRGQRNRFAIEVVEDGTATGALIVEGAVYWNTADQPFGAGANWPATRLP
jgi:WD40-like Beta Propeller Repeat